MPNASTAELGTESVLHVGIHGVLKVLSDDSPNDDDVYSLAVKLGRTKTHESGPSAGRPLWGHNDAGQDLRVDGVERQLAWLQVAPLLESPESRMPVTAAVNVLDAALQKLGQFDLTALHCVATVEDVTSSGSSGYPDANESSDGAAGVSVSLIGRSTEGPPHPDFTTLAERGLTLTRQEFPAVAPALDASGLWRITSDPANSGQLWSLAGTCKVPVFGPASLGGLTEQLLAELHNAGAVGPAMITLGADVRT